MAVNVFDLMATLSLDTNKYESGLTGAKSMAATVGGVIGNGLASAAKIGLTAVTAATGAIVAMGTASVKTGETFDKSMSQVFATMSDKANEVVKEGEYAGMKASDALRDFAQEMGRTTMFSASQSAEALNYMALAGYDATKSMSMLPNVLNLAAAGNMDLARASDMVTDTETAFGISTERTTQMVDEMAKAASTGNTSVEQLGDAFLTVGGLAKELNGGFVTLSDGTKAEVDGVQELEIALTAMANAGIKGSEAGTHMRNMLLKLSDPADAGAMALERMGVDVFDKVSGNMRSLKDIFYDLNIAMETMSQQEKIQTIGALFNTRDIASAEALLAAVEQDWNGIGEAILNADGAAEEMAKVQMDNLAGDITYFKSALEGAQIAISDALTPSLREFVKFGTSGLSQLTEAFTEGGLDAAMETFGTILADGLNMIIESLPKAVDAGMQLLGALGQGLLDNLDVITDAAVQIIGQLGIGFVVALPHIIDAAGQILTALGDAFITNLPIILKFAEDIIVNLVKGFVSAFPSLANGAAQIVTELAYSFTRLAPQLLEIGVDILNGITSGIDSDFGSIVDTALGVIDYFATSFIDNFDIITECGLDMLIALAQGIGENLPKIVEKIIEINNKITETIINHLPEFIEAGIMILKSLGEGIINSIPLIVENFRSTTDRVIEFVKSVDWKQVGQDIIDFIGQGIAFLAENIPKALKEIGEKGGEWIKEVDWKQVGQDIVDFIKDGIIYLIDTIPEKLKEIGNKAGEWLLNIDWVQVGKDIIGFLLDAFDFMFDELPNKIEEIGEAIKEKLLSIDWLQVGKDILSGIGKGLSGLVEIAGEFAEGGLEAFKEHYEINSPSKKMMWIGQMMNEGLAKGLQSTSDLVDSQISSSLDIASVSSNNTNSGNMIQNLTINAPTELNPSEIARQTRNANREFVLQMRTA